MAKYESENRIYKIISDGGSNMVAAFKDKTLEAYVERYLNELDRLAEPEREDMFFVRSLYVRRSRGLCAIKKFKGLFGR